MSHRPPAVPLIACDPYFSLWSFADRLTDVDTTHWTGTRQLLRGLVRVDGTAYRFLGADSTGTPAAEQVSLEVLPTRTVAVFAAGDARLTVTFTSAALPHDLDLLSRPVTYVDLEADRPVTVLLAASAELAVNTPGQQVTWGRYELGDGLHSLAVGTTEQRVLGTAGDDVRIDWGHLHLVAPAGARRCVTSLGQALRSFVAGEPLLGVDDVDFPRGATERWPALTCEVEVDGAASVVLAYDDRWSVEHQRRRLPAYWRRDGLGFADLLRRAVAEHDDVVQACRAFDDDLLARARAVGGDDLAYLVGLAYRQCLAAHKLVVDDLDGQPLHFSQGELLQRLHRDGRRHLSRGAALPAVQPGAARGAGRARPATTPPRPRWPFPFAPHDLGTYPHANGQVYGGGERTEDDQMPVEECGNMLLLVGRAGARATGSTKLVEEFADLLSGWAAYLEKQGFDPENQLCTDDFAGPMAHNANLSLKAILALGAWAALCTRTGRQEEGDRLRLVAKAMAGRWVTEAGDGRLGFDQPGTWSLKYNLLWDRLLGLGLFPASVAEAEVARYRDVLDDHGLPLDSRTRWAKVDWAVWAASLTGRREDLDAVVGPLVRWADTTPDRVPLTDWYWTSDSRCASFRARSVVGGVLAPLLVAEWS